MLKEIFKLPSDGEKLTEAQTNFMRILAGMYGIKHALGDKATQEDMEMAEEAREIINVFGSS